MQTRDDRVYTQWPTKRILSRQLMKHSGSQLREYARGYLSVVSTWNPWKIRYEQRHVHWRFLLAMLTHTFSNMRLAITLLAGYLPAVQYSSYPAPHRQSNQCSTSGWRSRHRVRHSASSAHQVPSASRERYSRMHCQTVGRRLLYPRAPFDCPPRSDPDRKLRRAMLHRRQGPTLRCRCRCRVRRLSSCPLVCRTVGTGDRSQASERCRL